MEMACIHTRKDDIIIYLYYGIIFKRPSDHVNIFLGSYRNMERDTNVSFPWSTIAAAAASAAATYASIHFMQRQKELYQYRRIENAVTIQYENPAFLQSPEGGARPEASSNVVQRRADPYDTRARSEYVFRTSINSMIVCIR